MVKRTGGTFFFLLRWKYGTGLAVLDGRGGWLGRASGGA